MGSNVEIEEVAQTIALLRAEFKDMPVFDRVRLDIWNAALEKFPTGAAQSAATRHITSSRWAPQLADIVRLCELQCNGGWPGADEAWALMPKSECESAMLTNEMAQAMDASAPLLQARDQNGARMAFRDTYNRLTEAAKIEGRGPKYFPSFGDDKVGALNMLAKAVSHGLIPIERAIECRPEHATEIVRMAGIKSHPLLAPPSHTGRQAVKALLANLRAKP